MTGYLCSLGSEDADRRKTQFLSFRSSYPKMMLFTLGNGSSGQCHITLYHSPLIVTFSIKTWYSVLLPLTAWYLRNSNKFGEEAGIGGSVTSMCCRWGQHHPASV